MRMISCWKLGTIVTPGGEDRLVRCAFSREICFVSQLPCRPSAHLWQAQYALRLWERFPQPIFYD